MTAKEAMRRLRREGFEERAGKGSHHVFRRGGRKVVVAAHAGDIPVGTLRQICKQAGWVAQIALGDFAGPPGR